MFVWKRIIIWKKYLFTIYGQLHDFVYFGGIENIYSNLNCLLLANLCLIHFVAILYYCNTNKKTVFGILKLN